MPETVSFEVTCENEGCEHLYMRVAGAMPAHARGSWVHALASQPQDFRGCPCGRVTRLQLTDQLELEQVLLPE